MYGRRLRRWGGGGGIRKSGTPDVRCLFHGVLDTYFRVLHGMVYVQKTKTNVCSVYLRGVACSGA